jgi:hypothetical protein
MAGPCVRTRPLSHWSTPSLAINGMRGFSVAKTNIDEMKSAQPQTRLKAVCAASRRPTYKGLRHFSVIHA